MDATKLLPRLSSALRALEAIDLRGTGLTRDDADTWRTGLLNLEHAEDAAKVGQWDEVHRLVDVALGELSRLLSLAEVDELEAIRSAIEDDGYERAAREEGLVFVAESFMQEVA